MTRVLRIRPAAIVDVDEAALFIARENLSAAMRLYDAVDETYRRIRRFPERGAAIDLGDHRLKEVRRHPIRGFPNHLVFHRIADRGVEVLRGLHGAREVLSLLSDELAG